MKDYGRRIRQGGDDAIAALSEYVAAIEPRWIPVEERLPEKAGRYLVATDADGDPYSDAATWFDGEWWTGWSPAQKWGANVTHWMPLPEPPC